MQSDAPLHEALGAEFVSAAHDPARGPSADAVEGVIILDDGFEAEEPEQLFVERETALEVADREHHMCDAIDFHLRVLFCRFASAAMTSSNSLSSVSRAALLSARRAPPSGPDWAARDRESDAAGRASRAPQLPRR